MASFAPSSYSDAQPRILQTGEVVGPSVLMNARREGRVQIVDLRTHGREVPEAMPASRWIGHAEGAELFLLGEPATCRQWAANRRLSHYAIVPPQMIEVHPLKGAPELSPAQAQAKFQRDKWPLYDISETVEFNQLRLPGSQRMDYQQFKLGQRTKLDRSKPFLVACRVGHRAQYVVRQLRQEGYKAYNVSGGLWQWECDGLPLETRAKQQARS